MTPLKAGALPIRSQKSVPSTNKKNIKYQAVSANQSTFTLTNDPANPLSQRLSSAVPFGHPTGCPCCRTLPDENGLNVGELLIGSESEDTLFAGPAASNQTLANYLRSGFWTDRFSSARKFNLSNSGTYAKRRHHLTTSNLFDPDGLSSASDLVTERSKFSKKSSGSTFSPTSMQIFALEMKPMVHTHQQPGLADPSTTSMSTSTPVGIQAAAALATTPFKRFCTRSAMAWD